MTVLTSAAYLHTPITSVGSEFMQLIYMCTVHQQTTVTPDNNTVFMFVRKKKCFNPHHHAAMVDFHLSSGTCTCTHMRAGDAPAKSKGRPTLLLIVRDAPAQSKGHSCSEQGHPFSEPEVLTNERVDLNTLNVGNGGEGVLDGG